MTPTARRRPATPAPGRGPRRARLVRQEQRRGGGGAAGRLPVLRHRACSTGRSPGSRSLRNVVGRATRPACGALAGEVELVADGAGRLARVLVDGVDRTGRRPHAAGRRRRVGGLGRARAAGRAAASASARSPRRGGDRDGRARHRDGGPARRGPQALPRRVGRGAGPAARRGARAGPGRARGRRDPDRAAPARRSSTRRGRWRRSGRPPTPGSSPTDGNRFEDTVDAVVDAILDAEARGRGVADRRRPRRRSTGATGTRADERPRADRQLDHAAHLGRHVRRARSSPGR